MVERKEPALVKVKNTDEIWARILADADRSRPFIKQHGAEVWSSLKKLVGRDVAFKLIDMERNEILVYLRTEHGFTLQSIADVFGITRERVRQLTPAGLWRKDSELVTWDKILVQVMMRAVVDRKAWGKQGRISRPWILERFGQDVATHISDAHRSTNKLEMILLYRLELSDRAACLKWMNTKYYQEGHTFRAIADLLSRQVPISTMCVHRGAKDMGFKGYSRGRRFDLDNQ